MDAFPTAGVTAADTVSAPAAVTVMPYKHEDPLFWISVYFAISLWLLMLIFTAGLLVPLVLFLALLGLFTRSLLIAWVRGNAVRVGPEQFPDLHRQFQHCCQRLGVKTTPELYLCQADGMLNALAVRFMRQNYVVLLSSVVDALKDRPEAVRFYMGHELAHIQRKHLTRHWWLAPAGITPLLAPAYSRACEYTCDRHGLACCDNLEDAQRALVVLAAGSERWKTMNLAAFEAQSQDTGRFWMAVNELTADYPWLCKRLVRLRDRDAPFPRRSIWAWLIAAVSPRLGYGGAVIGFLYLLMIGGAILALVLALTLSGTGIGDKMEEMGREVFSSLGLPDDTGDESASSEDDADEDTAVTEEPAPEPASVADLGAVGQALTEAVDTQVAQTDGRFPASLGDIEGIEARLNALAQDRWQNIEFGYLMPSESPNKVAEITLEASCSECGDETLSLQYRRQGSGRWKCTTVSPVEGVEVAGCAAPKR